MIEASSENESIPADQPIEGGAAVPIEEVAATKKVEEILAPVTKKSRGRWIALIVAVAIGLVGYFVIARGNSGPGGLEKIQGNVALSEQGLKDVVAANHLTVYWAGPVAGYKYTLLATTPGLIYVRYLPGGVGATDKTTPFRIVGTYVKKSAFAVGQYTGSLDGNIGTVNGDGNSVFYSASRPTNVYIGFKGKDIQVEVFDPVDGQALGLALMKNQIRQII